MLLVWESRTDSLVKSKGIKPEVFETKKKNGWAPFLPSFGSRTFPWFLRKFKLMLKNKFEEMDVSVFSVPFW